MKNKAHPYHHSANKDLTQRLIDIGVPLGLFLIFFKFYNFGKITPSEMVKTTGLLAISLLAITLLIGPLCKVVPSLEFLKAHRKFWGISSFLMAFVHTLLVFIYFFKFNWSRFIAFDNPKYPGIASGLLALAILLLVTLTSTKKALTILSPQAWKAVQLTSYLALILAVGHFYLMEQVNGVLVIKRLLGQITFWLAAAVVVFRLFILFLELFSHRSR